MAGMEETVEITSRKRKLDDDESQEENRSKRKLVAVAEPEIELLDLAEEILMEILNKLDGESLHTLGLISSQFKRLIRDKKLWTQAVFTSKELDIWEIFKRLKYILVTTRTLKIQGNCKKENIERRPLLNKQTFKEIMKRIVERSPLLQHLHFERVWFDWTKDFSISKFPANLRSLSFKNCIMPRTRSRRMIRTFTGIVDQMPHLEELRLEYCNFFESNDVMPFSKLQFLKTLSLRGCGKMKNCVPYMSLACRFGFPKLESLDLRETNVSDGELQCLNAIKTLKELLLEFPDIEPSNDDSEDDDFELFLRGPRRPVGQPNPAIAPQLPPRNDQLPREILPVEPVPGPSRASAPLSAPRNAEGGSTASRNGDAQSGSSKNNEEPSSSQNDDVASESSRNEDTPSSPREPDDRTDDSAPSSPESLSDSLSSSSSGPDDTPLRTIVIRANINAGGIPGQPNEPRIQVVFGGDVPHASRYLQFGRNQDQQQQLSVSDRGMLCFGVPRPNIMGNLVFFGNQPADPNTYLERIVLRNFRNITDTTLTHFQTNAPRLVHLDVRGCPQITREAVERFKSNRTDCVLICNYDNEE